MVNDLRSGRKLQEEKWETFYYFSDASFILSAGQDCSLSPVFGIDTFFPVTPVPLLLLMATFKRLNDWEYKVLDRLQDKISKRRGTVLK